MKKPSSHIRQEIARLQEALREAETREAERLGRIAMRAGLGDTGLAESDLQAAFEELAKRFRASSSREADGDRRSRNIGSSRTAAEIHADKATGSDREA